MQKIKTWFNQKENKITIYHYYPKRKWLSKLSWRITWGLIITIFLYGILLFYIHDPQPNERIIYSPLELLGFILILLTTVLFMCFYAYIDQICIKNTKFFIVADYDEAIDTLAELTNKDKDGFTFQGVKILPDLELATIEETEEGKN